MLVERTRHHHAGFYSLDPNIESREWIREGRFVMSVIPVLETERLRLRPMTLEDAPRVQLLAGDRLVAATTALIPHPYPDGAAEAFIARHEDQALKENHFTFGVVLRASGELIGCIGIGEDKPHRRAELGYWMGVPYWGKGYCTEAAKAVVDFVFERLPELNKVTACYLKTNGTSGRVMEKIGMKYEGTRAEHFFKWGQFYDEGMYGLLRRDWRKSA